ncbi:type I-E CRISPR-associated protein Cas6/Cse3/CasE [Candidatus Palauibacter sp.]|uniref:type I-E CRISPR-associated protein Cas6/Cse3/CasE n=1 Tax=Candidatus Palauibacter sp. TaxID=3101350 RepID=UPI003AF2F322
MTQMVYLPFRYAALGQWSGRRRLMRQGVFDEGYALHILLSGVFGKGVLQPFRTFRPSRAEEATLYAYSDLEEGALRAVSEAAAPPDCLEVIDVAGLRAKAMPAHFSAGQRLGFDIRVRPVRRLARDLPDSQSGKVIRKGSEIDAFRLELLRRSPDGSKDREVAPEATISRSDVYGRWLAERLTGAAEVDLRSCRLTSFRRRRVIRGEGRGPEGPDSVLHGECVVEDPTAFAATIAKGVGRHRAYGYGMLIVRPPGTPPQSR